MRQIGLDARHVKPHQQSHADFLQEVTLLHQGAGERHERSRGLLQFLTYWLAYHILGSDQSMAKQVVAIQAGQSPEQAYLDQEVMQEGATEPLLQALNGLFRQVSERNRELLELNVTLEAKVTQRTQSLSDANRLLEQMALTDVLTGLPNRRQAMSWLAQAWAQSERDNSPLTCMMIDADGFKQVNDRYGHDAGDEVLRRLSARLREAVRSNDVVCRLGGDEFLIICLGTGLDGVMQMAETMRQEVAKLHVALMDGEWPGSVSVGVAAKTREMENFDALIKAADEGLYRAKQNGRNCVACGNEPQP
jgi:hemerythrin